MGGPVFANGMEIASKASDCKVIAAFPDVCLSPPSPPAGPVPIPYPISSFASDTANGSKTVMIGGQEVMLKDQSYYKQCTGDEAATKSLGMGVTTGCITGKVYFTMWSPDVKFEGLNVDRHLDTTNGNGQSPANQATPWPNMGQMAAAPGAPAPTRNCNPSTVALDVGKNLLTLKHDRDTSLKVRVEPADVSVEAYRIEIKRSSGGGWCTLANSQTLNPWHAVIAGKFKLRGVATVCGNEHFTAEMDVEVQFPNYSQITGDGTVTSALDAAWTATKADCTETPVNQRRERAFWILLNTTSNAYQMGATQFGGWAGPADGASASVTVRPADNPATPGACDAGAVYPVAFFHTHTSTAFRAAAAPPGTVSVRPIGPSGADDSFHSSQTVPGIVYDYIASPPGSGSIPLGHPLGAPAQLYKSLGVDRRPTP